MRSIKSKNVSVSKLLVFALITMMLLSTLIGCGSQTQEATNTNAVDSTEAGNAGLPIVKEPITVSIFIASRAPQAMYDSNILSIKELTKRTNINFKIDTALNNQAQDRFKMLLASGNAPDIMCSSYGNINNYGVLGAFLELDDLIAKNAPNIKKYLIDDKVAHAETADSNGKQYAVPMLSAVRTAMGYCIRQDWLDKLKLKAPVTIDDWYNVLTAFKNNDLNGNGKTDEVPLLLDRAWENYFLNFADAWGIEMDPNKDYWFLKDNKIVYSPLLPEAKEFIATMAKWYGEKLIDQEFITREDTNNYHLLNNLAGATCYWTVVPAEINSRSEVKANDPNTNWQVIAPPVLKVGDKPMTYSQQNKTVGHSWAINAKTKYPDEIMKLFDYVYSDEGSLLFNFGVEGVSYEMKDGSPVYSEVVKNNKDGIRQYLMTNGLMPLIGMRQMKEYEFETAGNPDTIKQLMDYEVNDRFHEAVPVLNLSEYEKEKYDAKMAAIKTYTDEMIIKFIIGTEPLTKWDEFVKKINEMGIQDATKFKQDSLVRYNSIVK